MLAWAVLLEALGAALGAPPVSLPAPEQLPGTGPAHIGEQILQQQHAEVDRYFLARIEDARRRRPRRWHRDYN